MNFEKRSRREILQLLGVCSAPLLAAVPFAFLREKVEETPIGFEEVVLAKWKRLHPDVAIIGNSMVYCRMDVKYLTNLWKPLRTMQLSRGGTRSLQWFLWLKNFVAECAPVPRLAIVFYRDYDFNNVGMHIAGPHLDYIRAAMRPGDEPFLRLARGEDKDGGIRGWIDKHFSGTPENKQVRRKISDTAYDAAALLGPKSDDQLMAQVDATFDLDRLRSDAADADAVFNNNIDASMAKFSVDPETNYLSNFLEIANRHKIKLVFYRVKRRPNADNITPQDGALRAYTAAFKDWVETNGHHHVDETDDPRITLDMFRDGDHFHKEHYGKYTEWFAERLRPLLPHQFTNDEFKAAEKEALQIQKANAKPEAK